ncbi:DUF5365 family protein [Domibacillus iocasae]|uniref:Uncharacterized protein n=1 Tax=Domibacillus iocasae TaxID=1714016 RepID=A0A1E7DLQ9_9BACI|nr:DUF5365 family protein [Domibacillus iocasae]OES43994.1 hypothetical protein BA724_13000 [Domibacillus iocasae]
MSMLMSSTIEQEEKIKSLCSYLSKQVFPRYIQEEFVEVEKLFSIDGKTLEYVESLDDASRVITALNTIISILETSSISSGYEALFTESIHTLQSYQIAFPFPLSFFTEHKPAHFSK